MDITSLWGNTLKESLGYNWNPAGLPLSYWNSTTFMPVYCFAYYLFLNLLLHKCTVTIWYSLNHITDMMFLRPRFGHNSYYILTRAHTMVLCLETSILLWRLPRHHIRSAMIVFHKIIILLTCINLECVVVCEVLWLHLILSCHAIQRMLLSVSNGDRTSTRSSCTSYISYIVVIVLCESVLRGAPCGYPECTSRMHT